MRHGETDWNAQGRFQGNVDVPLNATGWAQAHAAADMLMHRGIAAIVSSPLSRACDTATVVADRLGLPVEIDDDLREVSITTQNGQGMEDWFGEWLAGRYIPPEGESFAALRARAVGAVERALTRPAPVLVVAHGTFFRALRAAMGIVSDMRTPNALPFLCTPAHPAWTLTPFGERQTA